MPMKKRRAPHGMASRNHCLTLRYYLHDLRPGPACRMTHVTLHVHVVCQLRQEDLTWRRVQP